MRQILYSLLLLALTACAPDKSANEADAHTSASPSPLNDSLELPSPGAPLPAVPDSLRRPSQKIDYMLCHYWDAVDFGNPKTVADTMLIEQTFADFAEMLPRVSDVAVAEAAINTLYDKASANPDAYLMMANTADKYLYTADSPMRNRALYRYFVARIVRGQTLTSEQRRHFADQLSHLDRQQSPN